MTSAQASHFGAHTAVRRYPLPRLHDLVTLAILAVAFVNAEGARAESSGRLRPCPSSPNCVSSLASDPAQRVEPLRVSGPADAVLARLKRALALLPRTRVVAEAPGYLHAEVTSAVFRFVDDVEVELDAAAGVAHVRSASRTGRYDFGVNRRRVEKLRALLLVDEPR